MPDEDPTHVLCPWTPIPWRLGLHLTLLPVDGAADQAAAFLALDAAVEADVLVPDEPPDGVDPALVAGQRLVELLGRLVDGGQPGPRDGGEVVVLVVQADVVGEPVEGPVVGEGLGHGDHVAGVPLRGGDGFVDVVLGDEVAGHGVEAACEEGGEQEVQQGVGGRVAQQEGVEGELDGEVDAVHPREGDAVDGHGPQGVEEDLEGAEEGLAEDGVEEEGFEGGGEVGVEAVYAEGFVVR